MVFTDFKSTTTKWRQKKHSTVIFVLFLNCPLPVISSRFLEPALLSPGCLLAVCARRTAGHSARHRCYQGQAAANGKPGNPHLTDTVDQWRRRNVGRHGRVPHLQKLLCSNAVGMWSCIHVTSLFPALNLHGCMHGWATGLFKLSNKKKETYFFYFFIPHYWRVRLIPVLQVYCMNKGK